MTSQTAPDDPGELLTIDEAALRLDVAPRLIRQRVDARRCPFVVQNGRRMVRVEDVMRSLPAWRNPPRQDGTENSQD